MNEKILVVDDEKDILTFLESILVREGFQVRKASNGKEALLIFETEPRFDLVITDIRMPEMDGLELVRHLRAADEDLEVIILTGFATFENAIGLLRDDGVSDYLIKPLENIEQLLISVNRALEKRQLRIENKRLFNDLVSAKTDLEQKVEKRTRELADRVKKLDCLFEISDICQRTDISLEEMIQDIVNKIPSGFRYPEICCARVRLDTEQVFETKDYKEQEPKLIHIICVNGERVGVMEVCYSQDIPEISGFPFLREEESLISSVAERLGRITEKIRNDEAFRNTHEELRQYAVKEAKLLARLQKEKRLAQAANQAKSDFLASMNRELRTPLNAIIGFTEILDSQSLGALNQKQKEHVRDIMQSGRYILDIVNDILDISEAESGRMTLELSRVSLKKLLESSLKKVREKSPDQGVSIDIDIPEALSSLSVMADECKLKQIMFNLLSNAFKFTSYGDRITLSMKRIQGPCPGKDYIEISVEDTGAGFPPEDREKIFDPFYQATGIKADIPGAGLGLTLIRHFVEIHGGTVRAESRGIQKGSRFSFVLPLNCKISEESSPRAGCNTGAVGLLQERTILNFFNDSIRSPEKSSKPVTFCRLHTEPDLLKANVWKLIEVLQEEKREHDMLGMSKSGQLYLILKDADSEKARTIFDRLARKTEKIFDADIYWSMATFPDNGELPKKLDLCGNR